MIWMRSLLNILMPCPRASNSGQMKTMRTSTCQAQKQSHRPLQSATAGATRVALPRVIGATTGITRARVAPRPTTTITTALQCHRGQHRTPKETEETASETITGTGERKERRETTSERKVRKEIGEWEETKASPKGREKRRAVILRSGSGHRKVTEGFLITRMEVKVAKMEAKRLMQMVGKLLVGQLVVAREEGGGTRVEMGEKTIFLAAAMMRTREGRRAAGKARMVARTERMARRDARRKGRAQSRKARAEKKMRTKMLQRMRRRSHRDRERLTAPA
mmetsp:Transcript_110233/g.201902  ORF Transcript_110233/g.201902 Transcript_110233/m.201902 type:complete len:279 (+) Transcript_110233:85-921(+)